MMVVGSQTGVSSFGRSRSSRPSRSSSSSSSHPVLAINMIVLMVSISAAIGFLSAVSAFPDGAPGSACVKHRPNHGAKSQSLETLPFKVEATAAEYKAGDTVAVRILGKAGVYFKGFFVQASDEKGRWIGHFEPTPFSVSHPECSATTHSENEEKEEVTLIWHPPKDSQGGRVRFLASILKNYKVYWVDAPAGVPAGTGSSKVLRRRR